MVLKILFPDLGWTLKFCGSMRGASVMKIKAKSMSLSILSTVIWQIMESVCSRALVKTQVGKSKAV